ncbi:MAG TPA: beta-ketoacyl-ACP synthase II [Thermoleophilaceae bacterium]
MSPRAAPDRRRRVVVTGVGAVTPLGCGAERLIERWLAGESGIENGEGACDEFDPRDHLRKREVRGTDRFAQLAIVAAKEALDQAGWTRRLPVEPSRVGCLVGTGFGGLQTIIDQIEVYRTRGARMISPLTISLMMPNAAAGGICLHFGLKGPAHAVGSACAAGTDAIGQAARMIADGDVDAMVAGGADACLTPLAVAATDKAGALSKTGISRPFDARRDGFVLGEGAGALALEAAEVADARGAERLGEVRGYGASVDAFHMTAPDPSGDGARRAIERCLHDAQVKALELDYVNAHGTSTPLNDRSETNALKQALGPIARSVPVSSTKSVIGHLCGGAGAVEAAATLLALRRRLAPPTVGYQEPDPELDLNYVPDVPQKLHPRSASVPLVAISNSFGFGGHNAVLCLSAP